jgi:hypothetical protein
MSNINKNVPDPWDFGLAIRSALESGLLDTSLLFDARLYRCKTDTRRIELTSNHKLSQLTHFLVSESWHYTFMGLKLFRI